VLAAGSLVQAAPAPGPSLTSDLPDEVIAAVAAKKPDGARGVLNEILRAATPYAFDANGIHALTDRRWFRVDSVEGAGAPALEIRRWPGDTVVAFYALPSDATATATASALGGLSLSGGEVTAGSCSVRDGKLETGKVARAVLWADCPAPGRRIGILGVPGDAGLGVAAKADLRHEILAVIEHARFEAGAATPTGLAAPDLPAPPIAADERHDAWQVFQGDGFTLGLPPGMRALRLDESLPPPRAMPEAAAWLRGRFTDRDGAAIAVGDGRRAGYVARVDAGNEAWRAGVAPPLGAPAADRLDEAELHDLVLEWTGAAKAVVSHWKEPGFSGDWLVFRLLLPGSGVEIGLPVVTGWRSLALFWIPATWRGPGRAPAPPPIDPAIGLGVKFDRLGPAEKARQALVEGTLVVGTLRVEIPRGYAPVANLSSPDGLPVTIYDAAGTVAGHIETMSAEGAAATVSGAGWAAQPRPGSRKAAAILLRADGACVLVARSGGGYLLAPEAGGKDRAGAWQRLVESASFVKAARRDEGSTPGRTDD
jgi:hypothetical protein